MDNQLSILVAAGLATFISLGVLLPKPEHVLFLYGVALGFPDLAISAGAINIRVDDCLLALLLFRVLIWPMAPLTFGQRRWLRWQTLLAGWCALSAGVGLASGVAPRLYETAKMIGCVAILVVLPRVLESERRLRFLIVGLMCGGIALLLQVLQRLILSSGNVLANFQQFKYAASFSTWNPNTIGQAAMLLVFAAGVGAALWPRSRLRNYVWFALATVFALTPVFLFARGSSLAIGAGYLVFLFLTRRWGPGLCLIAISALALAYLHARTGSLVEDAIRVDVATGQGFSKRYDRWNTAIAAIGEGPLLGHGFSQELPVLTKLGGEGVAHNAYLTVWIELGLAGLMVLLTSIYQYGATALTLYSTPRCRECGALLFALVVTVCIDSLALPTLYWQKLVTIGVAIGVGVIGVCERQSTSLDCEQVRERGNGRRYRCIVT